MTPIDRFDSSGKLYDRISQALLGLFAIYSVLQWPFLPKFVDIYYHLAVVRGFSDAGGWVPRDTWEFAPAGYPQLYPPLLHILLSLPYCLGVPAIELARCVDALSYPILLFSFWFLVRRRDGAAVSCWALFLFSTVYTAYLSSTLSAFNLAFTGVLWALYFVATKRAVAAGLMAAAVCYTHLMAAGILAGAWVILAMADATTRRTVLWAGGLALLLGSPFLIWQIKAADGFHLAGVKENSLLEIDVVLYGLALARVIGMLLRRKPDVWPLAIFLAMTPFLWTRQVRIVGGYGVLPVAWLAAQQLLSTIKTLEAGKEGMKIAVGAAVSAVIFFGVLAPTGIWDAKKSQAQILWADRTAVNLVLPDTGARFRVKGHSIYFEEEFQEIAKVLNERLEPDQLFWTDFPHAGGILYLMTGRSMTTGMLGEMGQWGDREMRLKNAKLLIWFKKANGQPSMEALEITRSLGLKFVADTPLAVIMENPAGGERRQTAGVKVPLMGLWAILAAWSAAMIVAVARRY